MSGREGEAGHTGTTKYEEMVPGLDPTNTLNQVLQELSGQLKVLVGTDLGTASSFFVAVAAGSRSKSRAAASAPSELSQRIGWPGFPGRERNSSSTCILHANDSSVFSYFENWQALSCALDPPE